MTIAGLRRGALAAAAAGVVAFAVIERDRLLDTVPRTASGWAKVGPLLVGLAIVLYALIRFVRPPLIRWGLVAAVLGVTAAFTVAPVFFDTRVEEQLLTSTAPATTPSSQAPAAPTPAAPAPATTAPAGPERLSTGRLEGKGGHSASGAASVYRLANGTTFVRLEDIDTPHAPAVYVYLVPRPGQTGTSGGVDLGALKGNQGSQNYVIPKDVDVSRYQTVLLWCRRFSTPIATATQAPG